jgi:hypothetical protein
MKVPDDLPFLMVISRFANGDFSPEANHQLLDVSWDHPIVFYIVSISGPPNKRGKDQQEHCCINGY